MSQFILVRYGTIPEVARFTYELPEPPGRLERVVVSTHRGLELGTALEIVRAPMSSGNGASQNGSAGDAGHAADGESIQRVLRRATPEDEVLHAELSREAQSVFAEWQQRIVDWKLDLDPIMAVEVE